MWKRWVLALAALTLLGACNKQAEVGSMEVQQVDWQKLAQKRIVFGHQSVGNNILEGVDALAKRDGVQFAVNRDTNAAGPGVVHFEIGRNGDPLSKIEAFSSTVNGGAGTGADVALMKLCYIDFSASSDARSIADAYVASLDKLEQQYPSTTFVAVTAPLTTAQTGPKAWVKKLLGKQPAGYLDNARRAEFNEILRQRYSAQNRLFDLARIESQGVSGGNTVAVDQRQVEVLDPAITDDGGHLNAAGQQLVAAQLLNFIAGLPARGQ